MKPTKQKGLVSAIKNIFGGKKAKKFRPTGSGASTITIGGFTKGTAGTTTRNELEYKPMPVIGHLPLKAQYIVGAGMLGANLLMAGICMSFYYSGLSSVSSAIQNATNAQTEIQRVAKNMSLAIKGDEAVFVSMKESQSRLNDGLTKAARVTQDFDEHQAFKAKKILASTNKHWKQNEKDIANALANEEVLIGTSKGLKKIEMLSTRINEQLNQAYDLMLQSGENDLMLQKVYFGMAIGERISKNIYEVSTSSSVDNSKIRSMQEDGAALRRLMDELSNISEENAKSDKMHDSIFRRLTASGYDVDMLDAIASAVAQNSKNTSTLINGNALLNKQSDTITAELGKIIDDYTVKLGQVNLRAYVGGMFALLGMVAFLLIVAINMKETQRQAIESKREQTATQNAIMRLLDEMGSLADGDLTIRATVSEEITGAIADSVNFAISQLAELVGQIQVAANQMDDATQRATEVSKRLLQINEQQSKDISETGQAVLRIANSIEEVSRRMSDSQRVAEQSVDSANKGMLAVSSSIEGMKTIQGTVEETAKRIRRLTDQSKEISEIVDLIADISERTSVLAINATVQATKAGAAGKGFKVVADAVQDLANQAADATRKIGALINAIQTDIQGAGAAMDKTSHEATQGVQLAEQAGEVFAEIGDVSMALADIVAEINVEVGKSAQDAASVSNTMQRVLESVDEASSSTKVTGDAIADLAKLSERLRDSVAGFKV